MKRILRLGNCYALTRYKLNQFKIRYISLLAALTSMCLYAVKQVSAQQAEPAATAVADIKPLQIGDTIPEWLWHHPLGRINHPNSEGRNTIILNEYRGKSIILDFWATWCGACLSGFPKMDTLKAAFGDDLAILLINAKQTGDNIERVRETLERLKVKTGYELKLPYVIGDSILQQFFPHNIVPHYVWINTAGEFAAATFKEEVTESSFAAFLQNGRADVHIKNDIPDFNAASTSLHEVAQSLKVAPVGRSLLTGYIEGLGFSGGVAETPDSNLRIYQINTPLAVLYNIAFKEQINNLPKSHFIFRLANNSDFMKRYFGIHERGNRYCYERIVPADNRAAISAIMGADLAGYFNVHVTREDVKTDVLILTAVRPVGIHSNGDFLQPVEGFVKRLNMFSPIPIINESGNGYTASIEIPASLHSLSAQQVMEWLEGHGFKVSSGERTLDVAVFENVQ